MEFVWSSIYSNRPSHSVTLKTTRSLTARNCTQGRNQGLKISEVRGVV